MSARQLFYMLVLVGLGAVWGCGSKPHPPVAIPELTPLTLEAWRELEPFEKYDPATFDRLKLNDPKLKSEKEWERFMRTVVIPERKIDVHARTEDEE